MKSRAYRVRLGEFQQETVMGLPARTPVLTPVVSAAMAPLYSKPNWSANISQGDWLLIQVYVTGNSSQNEPHLITLPQLVQVIGTDVFDMAFVLYCVQAWKAETRTTYRGELLTYPCLRQSQGEPQVLRIIDWDDALFVLGHWTQLPGWRAIRQAWVQAPYYKERPIHPAFTTAAIQPKLTTNLNLV